MTSKALLLAAAAAFSLTAAAHAQETVKPGSPPTEANPPVTTPESTLPPAPTEPTTDTPAPPPAPATAAEDAAKPVSTTESGWIGSWVVDSKGSKVGKIERVTTDRDGNVTGAEVRVDGRTVVVPTSTLSLKDGKATSTQTRSQIESTPPQ